MFARRLLLPDMERGLLGGSPASFWDHPRRRSYTIAQEFLNAPDVIGEPTGHGRGQQHFSRFSLGLSSPSAQFMMRPAEIVATSQQPPAAFQCHQPSGRVPTLARQTGQALAHGSIQALDKGGIEHRSALEKLPAMLEPA